MDSNRPRPHLSIPGTTAVIVGFALIATELRYGVLLSRVGLWARLLLYLAALLLAGWGLKAIISARWPAAAAHTARSRRNRFMWPVEGQVYVLIMMVLFCGSAVGHSNSLLLVFALMAGPFILNGWITFSMLKRLDVERNAPQRVMAGEPFSIELTLINPKWWFTAWLMSVRDKVDNGRESLHPEVLFARIPRKSRRTGRYQLRLSQRGRYSFGPVQVNSRFPLGLVERGLVLAHTAEILVYPRIGYLTPSWRRQLLTASQPISLAQSRGGTFDDDFHRIREYRPGDDPRAIHWRTTARRNEIMVREFRESRDRHLILLLDLFLPRSPSEAQSERLEYAISLAATICNDQMLSGRDTAIHFAANGTPFQEWGGSFDYGGREELFDLFALLRPNSQAEMSTLLDAALREQTPRSRTVLVTATAARAEHWNNIITRDAGAGENLVAVEPPQLVVADPSLLAPMFSLTPPQHRLKRD